MTQIHAYRVREADWGAGKGTREIEWGSQVLRTTA